MQIRLRNIFSNLYLKKLQKGLGKDFKDNPNPKDDNQFFLIAYLIKNLIK